MSGHELQVEFFNGARETRFISEREGRRALEAAKGDDTIRRAVLYRHAPDRRVVEDGLVWKARVGSWEARPGLRVRSVDGYDGEIVATPQGFYEPGHGDPSRAHVRWDYNGTVTPEFIDTLVRRDR
jgi:hypothetical protein